MRARMLLFFRLGEKGGVGAPLPPILLHPIHTPNAANVDGSPLLEAGLNSLPIIVTAWGGP